VSTLCNQIPYTFVAQGVFGSAVDSEKSDSSFEFWESCSVLTVVGKLKAIWLK
jgi:hypothetical protein